MQHLEKSNRFGVPAPKSSALPTGPHPDMKLENFSRSGQTCGQKPFLTADFEKSREKSARAATGFRIADFSGKIGSLSTQTRRPTNWATPGNIDLYSGRRCALQPLRGTEWL